MSLDQIIAFAIFAAVAAGTPGPSNVMLTAVGASVGWLRGLPCLFGVAAGMGALIFVSAFGLGGGLARLSDGGSGDEGGGHALPRLSRLEDRDFNRRAAGETMTAQSASGKRPDFSGSIPKPGWPASAPRPQASERRMRDVLWDSALLGAIFAAVGARRVHSRGLAFGSLIRRALVDARRRRVFNIIMGGLLAASAIMFWI